MKYAAFVVALTVAVPVHAQDMQTFMNNLNRQMGEAYGHYNAGQQIYRNAPYSSRLDLRCQNGDVNACYRWRQNTQRNMDAYDNYYRNHPLGRY